MKYLLLIYSDEAEEAKQTEAEQKQVYDDYWAFGEENKRLGLKTSGEALRPTSTATTVRVRDGKTLTTDGPFAETREQLGGYYEVDAKDIGEALAIAARIPGAKHGSVEVRPVMTFS